MNNSLEILEEAGLHPREAEVYYALLKLGESPIADVLRETGLHPQLVYRAIDGLLAKNLIVLSNRRHRKYIRAEDPHLLESLLKNKLEKVQQALPDLLALQSTSQDAIVRVSKGNEAIRSLRARGIEELNSGDIYYIIGASGDRFFEIMRDQYLEIERKRVKKGIKRRLISYESQRANIESGEPTGDLVEYKYLPADYPALTSTNIFSKTVAILIWSADPIVITIESEEVAESYRQYFEQLWIAGNK